MLLEKRTYFLKEISSDEENSDDFDEEYFEAKIQMNKTKLINLFLEKIYEIFVFQALQVPS